MKPAFCQKHSKVREDGNWRDENDLRGFLLYLRKPILCARCDICQQEQNLEATIRALRER
jgi:hypothetical protein